MTKPNFSQPRKKTIQNVSKENTTGRRGNRHEKRIAARTGDNTVSGSGSKPGRPADIRGITFLREAKTTRGRGRTISGKELEKITMQALSSNKIPVMEICFEGQVAPVPNDWVLIPASDFDALVKGE